MNRLPFIICETKGDWATLLRRWLPDRVSMIETRRLDEVWPRLHSDTTAVVALELTPDRADQLLAALIRIDQEFPQAASMVLADRSCASWEGIIREAGAVHFIASPRQASEITEVLRRRAATALVDGCDEGASLEEQILSRLPWSG